MASERQRYELAKTVVAKRAEGQKKGRGANGGMPMEENVVLRIGGGKGGGVELVRRFAGRQRLWRVQGNGAWHGRNGPGGSG